MSYLITGLFTDTKKAGDAIAELKNKGYAKEISLVTKDVTKKEGVHAHTVKENIADGTVGGGAVGATLGA